MLSPVPGSGLEVICSAAAKRRPPMNAHKLEQLIERLRPDYDYIVLDTPPCGIISDAKFICRCADAIVYVVRHDYASRNQIVDSMQELADQKAKAHRLRAERYSGGEPFQETTPATASMATVNTAPGKYRI